MGIVVGIVVGIVIGIIIGIGNIIGIVVGIGIVVVIVVGIVIGIAIDVVNVLAKDRNLVLVAQLLLDGRNIRDIRQGYPDALPLLGGRRTGAVTTPVSFLPVTAHIPPVYNAYTLVQCLRDLVQIHLVIFYRR